MADQSVTIGRIHAQRRKGAKEGAKNETGFLGVFVCAFASLRENPHFKLDHSAGARTRASDPPPMTDALDYRDAFGLTEFYR